MSYAASTDFLALLRQTPGGMRFERMPGLDFLIAGLARTGLFEVWVGQTAPIINQSSTVWFVPYAQSWAVEGSVFLWNAVSGDYEVATPDLWSALFSAVSLNGYVFQETTVDADTAGATTSLLAVRRAAPVLTTITLPSVASRNGKALQIADWSDAVVNHQMNLVPAIGETVMRRPDFDLYSTADQLAGAMLQPSNELSGWVIAP